MCVPVYAFDDAIIHSHAKRAIGWDQPILVVRSIAPLRIFMAAWGSIIFDSPTACHTNHFGFSLESYPPESLRLLTIVGAISGREAGRVTISFPLCVMALLPLAFGWLVLCGILLVPRHMTLWRRSRRRRLLLALPLPPPSPPPPFQLVVNIMTQPQPPLLLPPPQCLPLPQ
jgi:hypothetical protein